MFYKVKIDNEIIDALEDLQKVCFKNGLILRASKKDTPFGVISSDQSVIYHIDGWENAPDSFDGETVTLEECYDEDLYSQIISAVQSGTDTSEFETPSEESIADNKTPLERLAALENQNQMLIDCILEMADIIYA